MRKQNRFLKPLGRLGQVLLLGLSLGLAAPAGAGDPHAAYYCPDTDKVMWFIHASDPHVGTSGSADTGNLQWLVTTARQVIDPSFIVVSGDLTDSTNANWLGYPNGPYQAEWDAYRNILSSAGMEASFYFDLPGNHDAYNDQYFAYYRANSVQGRANDSTQMSWTRTGPWGTYHFMGVSTPDNTGDAFSLFWPYGDYAGLDGGELAFIGNALQNQAGAQLTLLFGHHPLAATGQADDTYVYYGRDEFVALLDGYRASLYGYGHTHVSSQQFYGANMTDGVFYFNVSSLGKDSPNQYTLTAIDCHGIASVTQNVGAWPVVLITAPLDRGLGGGTGWVNPFAYEVGNSASNPVRALVLDPNPATVQFRVDGGALQPMTAVAGNPRLWQGVWDASALAEGLYSLQVVATSASGSRSHTVTTALKVSQTVPKVGVATPLVTGKYITSGSGKNKTTTFTPTNSFKRGETVVIRATVQNPAGQPLAGASVQLAVTGPSQVNLTSGLSSAAGLAEAKWVTTAPNKRGAGGTPIGNYTATVSGVTLSGYLWDGNTPTVAFTLQ